MNRILVAVVLIASSCLAQETFDMNPRDGMVGISFGRIPKTDFTAKTGSYESRWSGINASLPVYRSINSAIEERSFQQISLTGSLRRNTTEFSLLSDPRVITTGWLGGSWLYIGEQKNFYLFSASIGFAEDRLIAGSPRMRVQLMTLGSYHLSDPLLIMYGASYSALFGRDLLMPILGMRWKMGEDWAGAIMLPFSFSLRYRAGSGVSFLAALTAAGDNVRIANRGDYAGYADDLQLRITGAKVSLRTMVKLSEAFGLNIVFGSITKRAMSIVSGSIVISTERLDASRFFSLGIRYRFSAGDNIPIEEVE